MTVMRWITGSLGLLFILAFMAGCKQPAYMTRDQFNDCMNIPGLPADLETKPGTSFTPEPGTLAMPTPRTILDPDRPARYLTLAEAIAIALEQGQVGIGTQTSQTGTLNDNLTSFTGRGLVRPDSIRVLAYDPALYGADIELSLSKFDAFWNTTMRWVTTDQPVGGNFLNNFQNGSTASFETGLVKPLPTGGVAGITFRTDYMNLVAPPVNVINNSYRPRLQFDFEQPLLQAFGVEINQLRADFPRPVIATDLANRFGTYPRISGTGAPGGDGILLARIRYDQSRAEFERQVNVMLLHVENAYWNLYRDYWLLYAREQALKQAYEAWRINKARFDTGREIIANLSQSRGQYELFRGQRLEALGQVLESERQLRGLMGLPAEDGTRLVPADSPTLAPYRPEWATALQEALALRPELVLAREELKIAQLQLIRQKNYLLPDLRVFASYNINAFGTQLDGPDPDLNAFRNLAANQFNDWTIGIRMNVPIGYRAEYAALRQFKILLAQSYWTLRNQEYKTELALTFSYRRMIQLYEQIRVFRAQREAFGEQLRARYQEYVAGRGALDILLEAQRFWADALSSEYRAIADYNVELANFEFNKGTIMQHDNVTIADGPLPECAQMRAAEHLKQWQNALILRERAVPHPPCNPEQGDPGLPALPSRGAPSLPELLHSAPRPPLVNPEQMPLPETAPPPAQENQEPLVPIPATPPATDLPTTPQNPLPSTANPIQPIPATPATADLPTNPQITPSISASPIQPIPAMPAISKLPTTPWNALPSTANPIQPMPLNSSGEPGKR